MSAIRCRILKQGNEGISPWVGLALGLLYLGAVVGVGTAAIYVQRSAMAEQKLAIAEQWASWLARHLAHIETAGPEALQRELRQFAREPGVSFCAMVSSAGQIIAHSDSRQIGQPVSTTPFSSGERVQLLSEVGEEHEPGFVLAARSLPPGEGREGLEIRVGFAPVSLAWGQSDMLFWVGYILLAVLGLYLLVYRLLRRSVQPLAMIRNRLLDCNEQIPDRLMALRLNDSYDQTSASWNHLVEFVAEMKEQLGQAQLTTDVTAAMDGYRSQRLTELLMQIPFGVLVVDGTGTISFANRAATGLLRPDGATLEGEPATSVFDESLSSALLTPGRARRTSQTATGRWVDKTFEHPRSTVVLRFWSNPSDSGSNEYVIFIQDVTQAKEAERARDNFLYHVTHELRTPLTNIRAYAETLSQGVIDDEQTIRECYNVIMGETSRLGRLVEDILNVSQLEVGTAKLEQREVQLADVLRKVVQDNQASADAKNIDLVLRMPAKAPRVTGDRERLAVVFSNLIGNGIKYTPANGRVEIRCSVEQQRAEISVADTGIGIDPQYHDKVFEKFFRVNDEKVETVPGTGLGLAIARETVRVHGGALLLSSTPGQGSTFTVVLPALSVEGKSHDKQMDGTAARESA